MTRHRDVTDSDCSIARALGVVGDWWSLLVVRDIAGGLHRFEALQAELGVSRKVLAERLYSLVTDGVLVRRRYQERPDRFEYHLTEAGRGLLPVLVALQSWGAQYIIGDGSLTATSVDDSIETRRVQSLAGATVPWLRLPASTDVSLDPVGGSTWTVLYGYPGAFAPHHHGYPPGWDSIPGAQGCTLESRTYNERIVEFTERGARVVGFSTQRPDQIVAFADHAGLRFPLLSDFDLQLTTALRLPTFRAGGSDRLKRITLIVDAHRVIRGVLYPITDVLASIDDALTSIDRLRDADLEGVPR